MPFGIDPKLVPPPIPVIDQDDSIPGDWLGTEEEGAPSSASAEMVPLSRSLEGFVLADPGLIESQRQQAIQRWEVTKKKARALEELIASAGRPQVKGSLFSGLLRPETPSRQLPTRPFLKLAEEYENVGRYAATAKVKAPEAYSAFRRSADLFFKSATEYADPNYAARALDVLTLARREAEVAHSYHTPLMVLQTLEAAQPLLEHLFKATASDTRMHQQYRADRAFGLLDIQAHKSRHPDLPGTKVNGTIIQHCRDEIYKAESAFWRAVPSTIDKIRFTLANASRMLGLFDATIADARRNVERLESAFDLVDWDGKLKTAPLFLGFYHQGASHANQRGGWLNSASRMLAKIGRDAQGDATRLETARDLAQEFVARSMSQKFDKDVLPVFDSINLLIATLAERQASLVADPEAQKLLDQARERYDQAVTFRNLYPDLNLPDVASDQVRVKRALSKSQESATSQSAETRPPLRAAIRDELQRISERIIDLLLKPEEISFRPIEHALIELATHPYVTDAVRKAFADDLPHRLSSLEPKLREKRIRTAREFLGFGAVTTPDQLSPEELDVLDAVLDSYRKGENAEGDTEEAKTRNRNESWLKAGVTLATLFSFHPNLDTPEANERFITERMNYIICRLVELLESSPHARAHVRKQYHENLGNTPPPLASKIMAPIAPAGAIKPDELERLIEEGLEKSTEEIVMSSTPSRGVPRASVLEDGNTSPSDSMIFRPGWIRIIRDGNTARPARLSLARVDHRRSLHARQTHAHSIFRARQRARQLNAARASRRATQSLLLNRSLWMRNASVYRAAHTLRFTR